jgi:AcrR family transcriptional regulator
MTRNDFWSFLFMKQGSKQQSTRDSILDATDRLLARAGYKKMTIDDLAREVGIGKGSVYLHFTSKEEIALSHIDRIIERLKTKLVEISEKRTPASDRLLEMLEFRVLFRFDSVQNYSQSLNELLAHVRPRLLERREKYFGEEAAILSRVVADGQKAGDFAEGDPLDLARTMVTATNSLLPYSLSAFELGNKKILQKATRKVGEMLVRGIRK